VCEFIHQAPGTDRVSRPTAAAAAALRTGLRKEKRAGKEEEK